MGYFYPELYFFYLVIYNSERMKKQTINEKRNRDPISYHKIARLVTTQKCYNRKYPEAVKCNYGYINSLFKRFVNKNINKKHFDFIVTPGGFLYFKFPSQLYDEHIDIENPTRKQIQLLHEQARMTIEDFLHDKLANSIFEDLKNIADYITIGIDGKSSSQKIELIAIYDLKRNEVIHWTGKFYPTKSQEKYLIRYPYLGSHFIKLNGYKLMILGCHDLSVFSNRGQSIAMNWRKDVAEIFKSKCRMFKPSIVLQHPHNTDSSITWRASWLELERELPDVTDYAAGIHFDEEEHRSSLEDVLLKYKKGHVLDFR